MDTDPKLYNYLGPALVHVYGAETCCVHQCSARGYVAVAELTCGTMLSPGAELGIFRAEMTRSDPYSLNKTLRLGENNGGS